MLEESRQSPTSPLQRMSRKHANLWDCVTGTVHIWIPNYSQIASSITSLWRKGVEFVWTEEEEAAFEALKEYVTTAPVLTSINYTCD